MELKVTAPEVVTPLPRETWPDLMPRLVKVDAAAGVVQVITELPPAWEVKTWPAVPAVAGKLKL